MMAKWLSFPRRRESSSMPRTYYIYILASKHNGTLYIGVTNSLARRVWDHKEGIIPGFTKKYSVKLLVYYEEFKDIRDAIAREKALKKWNRSWKIKLIESMNHNWNDLYEDLAK